MEIRNIHKHAGWFASYTDEKQGKALIQCFQAKVSALEEFIETVIAELDQDDIAPELRIASAKQMLQNPPKVEAREGSFKWEG